MASALTVVIRGRSWMSIAHTTLVRIGCVALMMALMTLSSEAGNPKTKVKIKKEFREVSYSFTDIDTVVVYAARMSPPRPRKMGGARVWQPENELPSDSVCLELAREIGKSINRRDSTATVIVLLNRDSAATDSSLTAFARDSIGADVVFLAEAIESRTEASSPPMSFSFLGSHTNVGGHDAQAIAKIRFSIQDAVDGTLVWSVTCEAKHKTGGGGMFDFKGEPPPPVEAAVAAAYTTAMSKLPF